MIILLTDFYAKRPHVPMGLRLIPNIFGASIVELRPLSGEVAQFIFSPDERVVLHVRYMSEFQTFAQYRISVK